MRRLRRMDKNEAMIKYLLTCPTILNNPLFFNFINAKDNNNQIVTESNEKLLNQPYIDGSVLKQYNISIILFKSISSNAIVKPIGTSEYPDENVADLALVQELIDWISEQADLGNYPNFGNDCVVDSIQTETNNPVFDGIDDTVQPNLARYSVTIQVEYLDNSKKIWN